MTPERQSPADPPGQADAPMPATVDPGDDTEDGRAGDARVDDDVTQHSGTPLPRPDDDDLPPMPPGHPSDRRT